MVRTLLETKQEIKRIREGIERKGGRYPGRIEAVTIRIRRLKAGKWIERAIRSVVEEVKKVEKGLKEPEVDVKKVDVKIYRASYVVMYYVRKEALKRASGRKYDPLAEFRCYVFTQRGREVITELKNELDSAIRDMEYQGRHTLSASIDGGYVREQGEEEKHEVALVIRGKEFEQVDRDERVDSEGNLIELERKRFYCRFFGDGRYVYSYTGTQWVRDSEWPALGKLKVKEAPKREGEEKEKKEREREKEARK